MAKRLEDKVAVVVGAGQTPGDTIGNGRATAILFAREGARVMCVDRDLSSARDTVATARDLTVRLSAERTAPLLESVPRAFHGTVNDTLLTALALALGDWAERSGRVGSGADPVRGGGSGSRPSPAETPGCRAAVRRW